MTTNVNRTLVVVCRHVATVVCVLLIGASLPLTALALSPALPPPPPPPPPAPTPTPQPPTPTPVPPAPQPVHGAPIELRVQPAYEEVWQTYFWQDLWTVVQWQDLGGLWHDVEGWQGTLDEIVDGTGQKMWWVAEGDLAKGPFRWVIYQNQGGPTLSNSESFYLPVASGKGVTVEVTLGP